MLHSDVLDTFIFKDGRIYLREFHIDRSFEALQLLNPKIDRASIAEIYFELERAGQIIGLDLIGNPNDSQPTRLLLSAENLGRYKAESIQKTTLNSPVRLEIVTSRQNPAGKGLQNYKWEHRQLWNELLSFKTEKADDVIAVNTAGKITETSRFNLFFFDVMDDCVLTPTLDSGCINGVYRRYALSTKSIDLPDLGTKKLIEKDITVEQLATNLNNYKIYVANSVRGVLNAWLITQNLPPKN